MTTKKEIQYIGKDEIAVADLTDSTFSTNEDLNDYMQDWDDGTEFTIFTKSRVVRVDKSTKLVEVKLKK